MKINQITKSPSFGSVLRADEKFSDKQLSIAKDIKTKMNTVYDGHFDNQTPNNWLERKKRDTLVKTGNSNDSVRFFITTQATKDPAIRPMVNIDCFVGEYSEQKPFYVQDIKEAHKQQWLSLGTMIVAALTMIATMISFTNFSRNHAKEKVMQNKEVVIDTLKNKLSNDTIAPFKMKK